MNPTETGRYVAESVAFYAGFSGFFVHSAPSEAARQYLRGLLAPVPRKYRRQMAEETGAGDAQ